MKYRSGQSLVSLAPFFSVVTQRSSLQTADIRTTFLSLCCLCANEITNIVSDVTNQSKGECNQYRFSRELASVLLQVRKHRKRLSKSIFVLFVPLQLRKNILHIWEKFFRFLSDY